MDKINRMISGGKRVWVGEQSNKLTLCLKKPLLVLGFGLIRP